MEKFVITTKKINNDYPFSKIYSLDSISFPNNFIEKISFKIFGKSNFFKEKLKASDLLHSHFGDAGKKIMNTSKSLNVPTITSFYGRDCYSIPKGNKSFYNFLFENGDAFLVLGNNMKIELSFLGCDKDKINVHHLGVDYKPDKKKLRKDKIVFLIVARFVEKKGIEYAIKAFAKFSREFPDSELRIVGYGPLEKKLIHMSKLLCENKAIFVNNSAFENPRAVVEKEYLNADVFVLPSVTSKNGDKEGTPVTLMEAQLNGLPCISTFHSDIPEVVLDKKTGFLVPEKNSDALYKKMVSIAEKPSLIKLMGKRGNNHIKKEFNLKIQAKNLEKIYKSLI